MPDYRIPNLANACTVLKHLATLPGPVGLGPMARDLGIPRTTLLRITSTLVAEGFLTEQEGRYTLGFALIPLGQAALDRQDLRASAAPYVRALAEATGETAHLAVPAGPQVLLLEVVQSPHPIRVGAPAGTLVAYPCSATGKIFLAHLLRDHLGDFLPQPPRTPHTYCTVEAIQPELDRILAQGYAMDEEEYCEGVRCLACPVRDASGTVVAALGITGATLRFKPEHIPAVALRVQDAALRLSRALGWG